MISGMKLVMPLLVTLCHLNRQCNAAGWSYEDPTGPYQWPYMFPTCNGYRQTPIDIDTWGITCTENQVVEFLNYRTALTNAKIVNNGHTFQVSGTSSAQVVTNFGSQPETYNFAQFHAHWGSDNSQGSEHTIDGRQFPMELHLVHTNAKYPNDYINRTNGIAVVGIFFKISKLDNPILKPLVDSLSKIVNENAETSLPENSIKLSSFLPGLFLRMYTYRGSLTTPKCNEVVRWLVLPTPIPISDYQLQKFRMLKDSSGQPMVDNFRPVQELYGRAVCYAQGTVE